MTLIINEKKKFAKIPRIYSDDKFGDKKSEWK